MKLENPKNTQSIHSSVLREYCMHHPGRKWRNAMGSQGLLWFVQGPSERPVLEDEKEYSSQSVWRETWGSYAQVSGAVTHNQLQTQKKKNYMGCLFGENVFYLQQVEVLSMDFCTPKRKPVTQVNRSLAPWEFTRKELRTDIYFLLIVKDNRNSISIATRCLGV